MKPSRHEHGAVMIFVLFVLALAVATLAPAVIQSFYRAQAARASVARTVAQSDAAGAALSMKRIISGPLREVVREEARSTAAFGSSYYFGSGDATSVASALASLASRIQTRADAIFCDYQPSDTQTQVSIRVYFTSAACGQALPSGLTLPQASMTQGRANGFQEYLVPFIAITSTTAGEFVGERVFQGSFRLGLGSDSFARYALFVHNNYYPDGSPGYLRSWNVLEGPVHVNGLLNVWGTPYVTGAVTTGSCPSLSPAGDCSVSVTPALGVYSEGVIPAASLTPSPESPCYPGGDCPTFAGGVDYSAALIPLPDELTNPILAAATTDGVVFPEEVTEFFLDRGNSPLTAGLEAQILEVTGETRTWRFFQEAGTPQLWLETPPGDNLVLNYDFRSSTTNGWVYPPSLVALPSSAAEVPSGAPTPYVARLDRRDAYYGPRFPAQPGDEFDVSIDAASGTATGVTGTGTYQLQVGLRFIKSDGTSTWIGTATSGSGAVPNDGAWHTSTGTITAPADTVEAQVWVQIDQPTSESYTYYFTNVRVSPSAHTEYSIVANAFNGAFYAAGSIDQLHGPPAGQALHPNTRLSIGAMGDIRISDNLYLGDPPCSGGPGFVGGSVVPSTCANLSSVNVLGLYSHTGNILIKNPAPDTLHIEAALMARSGWVGAENYDLRDAQGNVFVLGSITEARYGQFGVSNADGALASGYHLTLVYDPRFAPNTAAYPPAWPTYSGQLLYVVTGPLNEIR